MEDNEPKHGIDEASDFFVGDSEGGFAYSALSEIESLYERISESFERIEQREPARDEIVVLTPEERGQLLEYYAIVHAHLERLSACLLYEHVGDKENRSPESTLNFFRDEFSQAKREGLLFHTGIIDSGFKGEMAKIRSVRNQLVHQQHKRMYVDLSNKTKSDIDRSYDAICELDERLNEAAGINAED